MKIKIVLTIGLYFFMYSGTYSQCTDTFDIGNQFIPCGYMGCEKEIELYTSFKINPKSSPSCIKCNFLKSCSKGWAGMYWNNIAVDSICNWGQFTGEDFSACGYKKLTFWAKGEKGGEVVEFGTGGISDPKLSYKDSITPSYKNKIKKNLILTREWVQYSIDLINQDLKSVIGGFYWVAKWNSNPSGLEFYLDDIQFEK